MKDGLVKYFVIIAWVDLRGGPIRRRSPRSLAWPSTTARPRKRCHHRALECFKGTAESSLAEQRNRQFHNGTSSPRHQFNIFTESGGSTGTGNGDSVLCWRSMLRENPSRPDNSTLLRQHSKLFLKTVLPKLCRGLSPCSLWIHML